MYIIIMMVKRRSECTEDKHTHTYMYANMHTHASRDYSCTIPGKVGCLCNWEKGLPVAEGIEGAATH